MIKLYGTSWCGECIALKRYLDGKGVAYEETTVPDSQRDRHEVKQVSGQWTVPVLDIDGEIIIGFDQKAIDDALTAAR